LFAKHLFGPNLEIFQGTKFGGPLGGNPPPPKVALLSEIFELLNIEV